MMMMLKGCKRCGGDLLETSDVYGRYTQCMQCGAILDLPDERTFGGVKAAAEKASAKTGVAA
jgi:predicted  nucleic acid-binding Zn-ribbon protein